MNNSQAQYCTACGQFRVLTSILVCTPCYLAWYDRYTTEHRTEHSYS